MCQPYMYMNRICATNNMNTPTAILEYMNNNGNVLGSV